MDNLTFSKIQEALGKYKNIAIVVPVNPSIDEMGAALGLYLSMANLGKNLTIATPNAPLVEVSSLVGIDKVTTSLGGEGGDLIVSFPYKEGEIEKVSYTRDDNFLNIVVKAGELGLNFQEQDVKFTRGGAGPELLFVVGAARISDLGNLYNPAQLKDTVVINIDNKADNQGFGDILMVSPRFSSISEAMANLILGLNLKLDVDVAQNLMNGIASATDNFQSELASSLAFEMAGILMRTGAVRPNSSFAPTPRVQAQRPVDNFIKQQEELVRSQTEQPLTEEKPIDTVERKEGAPQPVQPVNPPEDWLEPKIYKGSTNF